MSLLLSLFCNEVDLGLGSDKFRGNLSATFSTSSEREFLQESDSTEDRISNWLKSKGIIVSDPSSKQRDFFEKSKQAVFHLKERIETTSDDKREEKHLLSGTGPTARKPSDTYSNSRIYTSSRKSILQRRGLQATSLDCSTPTSAAKSAQ